MMRKINIVIAMLLCVTLNSFTAQKKSENLKKAVALVAIAGAVAVNGDYLPVAFQNVLAGFIGKEKIVCSDAEIAPGADCEKYTIEGICRFTDQGPRVAQVIGSQYFSPYNTRWCFGGCRPFAQVADEMVALKAQCEARTARESAQESRAQPSKPLVNVSHRNATLDRLHENIAKKAQARKSKK